MASFIGVSSLKAITHDNRGSKPSHFHPASSRTRKLLGYSTGKQLFDLLLLQSVAAKILLRAEEVKKSSNESAKTRYK